MSDERLAVLVDGAPLAAEAARALWTEFSAHMDANQGDFKGFAQKKAWVSVAPEFRNGKAVLIVRTGAPMAKPPPAPRGAAHRPKPRPQAKGKPAQRPHASPAEGAKPKAKGAEPAKKTAKGPGVTGPAKRAAAPAKRAQTPAKPRRG
jgi:hypothetical protein